MQESLDERTTSKRVSFAVFAQGFADSFHPQARLFTRGALLQVLTCCGSKAKQRREGFLPAVPCSACRWLSKQHPHGDNGGGSARTHAHTQAVTERRGKGEGGRKRVDERRVEGGEGE